MGALDYDSLVCPLYPKILLQYLKLYKLELYFTLATTLTTIKTTNTTYYLLLRHLKLRFVKSI